MKCDGFRMSRGFSVALLVVGTFLGSACTEDVNVDGGTTGTVTCVVDTDCEAGSFCEDSACVLQRPEVQPDGGSSESTDGGGTSAPEDGGASPMGELAVLPSTTIEFGAQRLGLSVERTVTLTNVGNAPLTIVTVFLDGNESNEFTVSETGGLNLTLDPGDGKTLILTHTPIDAHPDEAALRIVHTANADEPLTISLFAEFKGQATLSVTMDRLALTPSISEVLMGDVPVGAEQHASVYLRNDGASDSILSLSQVSLTPLTAGFEIVHLDASDVLLSSFDGFCDSASECTSESSSCEGGLCVLGDGSIADTFQIDITYQSTQVGMVSSILSLTYQVNGETEQLDIPLVAVGTQGQLMATPGSLDFADAIVERSKELTVSVSNVGDASVLVSGVEFAQGTGLSILASPELPVDIAPSESEEFTVQLLGAMDGPIDDAMTLLSDQEEVLNIPVTGTLRFAPEIDVDSPLVFGQVFRGTLSTLPLTIRNFGPGDLTVSSIEIQDDTNQVFSVTSPDLSEPLSPLENPEDTEPVFQLNVHYQPEDAAPNGLFDTATLVIQSDDPDAPSSEVELSGLRVAPEILITPATIHFGNVPIGQSALEQTIEIHKSGFGDLVVSDIQFDASGPYDIAVQQSLPATIELGGEPLRITVNYTPQAVGTLPVETISIFSNDMINTPKIVSILGAGVVGELEITPAPVQFSETFIGHEPTRTITVENVSDIAVTVSHATFPSSSSFAVDTSQMPFTVQPGFSRTIDITFAPTEAGFYSQSLTIQSDLPEQISIGVSGNARHAPALLVDTTLMDFDGVYTGNSRAMERIIRNFPDNGQGLLHIEDIRIEGDGAAYFSVVPSFITEAIAPIDHEDSLTPSETLIVTYTPAAGANDGPSCAPPDEAVLIIETDDPEQPTASIPLRGLPITPTISFSSQTINAGGVKVNTTSEAMTISVQNVGCGPLLISSITAPLFSPVSLTPTGSFPFGETPLAKGDTATLTATFTPTEVGPSVTTFVLYSNDESNPVNNITVQGTGLIGRLEASEIDFSDVVVGVTSTQVMTITNTGDAVVDISQIKLTDETVFELISPPAAQSLEPDGNIEITIAMTAAADGTFSDTLVVTSDLPDELSVPVSGTAHYEGTVFLDPESVGFGDKKVDQSYQEVVHIRNQGSSPLLVTAASITGDAAFTISTDPAIPVEGQVLQPFVDAIALTITYAPTATGAHSATVFVTSSDPEESTASVSVSGNGIQGQLEADPSPLQFASANLVEGPFVGRELEKTITLSNTGTASVILSAVTLQDPSAGYPDDTAFSIASFNGQDPSTVLPYTLGVNESVPLAIRFLTEAAGSNFADQLQVHSDLTNPFTVDLQGESRHAPSILVPAGDVDFGGVYVGNTGNHTLSIRNEGTDGQGNLTILGMDITGPHANRFSFSPSSFTDPLAPLAAAGDLSPNLSVDIIYTPDPTANQSGSCAPEDTATFVIQSDDPDQPTVSIPLKGRPVNPTLAVEPSASADFGSVKVETSATVQVITLRNEGCGNLSISNLAFPAGTSFLSSHQGSNPFGTAGLEQNQTTTFTLGFQPAATGAHNTTFFIHSNDETNASQPFTLSGVGILGELSSTPANLDFPNGVVDVSDTKTITLRNTGDAPLNIESVSLLNAGTAFSVADSSVLLAPNATHEVDVTFLATTPGNHQNTLFVVSDLPDSPFSIALNGDAAYEGNIVLTPATYNFGEHDVFSAAPSSQIVITNDGPSPLEITAINVPAIDGFSAQVVGATLPFVIEVSGADSSLTVQVDFTPQSPGDQNASLTITNTDPDNGSATVALSGRGKVCDSLAGTSFVQTGPNCTYSCLSDFWDLNSDLNTAGSDGCEYACVFANTNDAPDDAFVDSNCDGIDGVIADAIFVDTGTGNDSNSGSMVAPLATIGAAIATQDNGRPILVSTGTYNESLNLKNGASIYGGYAAADSWSRSNANGATIAGGVTAVTALSISSTTLLTHLNITASSNTSGDSIGLYANASSGLVLRNLSITAQDGADGTDGTGGTAGDDGNAGTEGTQGCDGCSGDGWGGSGGTGCLTWNGGGFGGRGGYGDNNGLNGDHGNSDDTGGTRGSGGSGDGSHSCLFGCGGGGAPGEHAAQNEDLDGSDGTDGVGGDGIGTISGDKWTPSDGTNGTSGSAGDGGGGGGGGGGSDCCLDDRGGGGGGGGGGGCGGSAGTAGTGGYSSFGVFLYDSSITMVNVDVTSGNAGDGGAGKPGGSGGTGGARGAYGAAADDGDRGGYGAKGGDGGDGGDGGGGGGGLSYCIFRSGSSSPTLTNISFSHGNAGTGGAGGQSTNGGSNGSSGNLY